MWGSWRDRGLKEKRRGGGGDVAQSRRSMGGFIYLDFQIADDLSPPHPLPRFTILLKLAVPLFQPSEVDFRH